MSKATGRDGTGGALLAAIVGWVAVGTMASAGCTGGDLPDAGCTNHSDCPAGHMCQKATGACLPMPCNGACDENEETCLNNRCEKLAGLSCAADSTRCGAKFTCGASKVCMRNCAGVDDAAECPDRDYPRCNLETNYCAQCSFPDDCAARADKKICDLPTGLCVECSSGLDCLVSGLPAGRYCDAQTRTCEDGCTDHSDCPVGKLCDATGGAVGRCIECLNDTHCYEPPKLRCEPAAHKCVQCLNDTDCATGTKNRCLEATHECVVCVRNQDCPSNQICNQETFTCQPGCTGGLGGANCQTGWVCDTAFGDHGRCLECLANDNQCPRTKVCVAKTVDGVPTYGCESGCRERGAGLPSDARCADPNHLAVDTKCNGQALPYGKCVQCLNDGQCDAPKACDKERFVCRCRKEGETCTHNADCGFDGFNASGQPICRDATTLRFYCVNRIQCYGTTKTVSPPVCTRSASALPGEQGNCPTNFVSEEAWDVDGAATNATRQCVPRTNRCG